MKTTQLIAAAFALIFALPQAAFAQTNGKEWLNAPIHTGTEKPRQSLSEDLYFEVVASMLPIAIYRDLKDVAVVALDEYGARSYTGPYFHCPKESSPFLLRAVYGHAGSGRFLVSQSQDAVLVAHGSLGRSTEYNKTALVACLRDRPEAVYTTVSIAE